MFSKLFKSKKRDVVQYIIVLSVIAIILAFAFPKIRDKMGATHNATVSNLDVGMGSMFSNSIQNAPQSQDTIITEDFEDATYAFPFSFSSQSWEIDTDINNAQQGSKSIKGKAYPQSVAYLAGCLCSYWTYAPRVSSTQINVPSGFTAKLSFYYNLKLLYAGRGTLTILWDGTQIVNTNGGSTGSTGWQNYQQEGISSGNHTLTFKFTETTPQNVYNNYDQTSAGYLDNIQVTLTPN